MILLLVFYTGSLNNVREHFQDIGNFKCSFVETLQVQNDTFHFSGEVFVERENSRIDVEEPDPQIMIFRGDSVLRLDKKTGTTQKYLAPLSLSNILYFPDNYYRVDSISHGVYFLSPYNEELTFPVTIKFNDELFPEELSFKQKGGGGKFYFFDFRTDVEFSRGLFNPDSLK